MQTIEYKPSGFKLSLGKEIKLELNSCKRTEPSEEIKTAVTCSTENLDNGIKGKWVTTKKIEYPELHKYDLVYKTAKDVYQSRNLSLYEKFSTLLYCFGVTEKELLVLHEKYYYLHALTKPYLQGETPELLMKHYKRWWHDNKESVLAAFNRRLKKPKEVNGELPDVNDLVSFNKRAGKGLFTGVVRRIVTDKRYGTEYCEIRVGNKVMHKERKKCTVIKF